MNNIAKDINKLLKENSTVKEYLKLKKEINNDKDLINKKQRLDTLRKQICADKKEFDEEYYDLLNDYCNNVKVKEYEKVSKEIKDLMLDISDILSLK